MNLFKLLPLFVLILLFTGCGSTMKMDDITIQSIATYSDPFEGINGNNSFEHATSLNINETIQNAVLCIYPKNDEDFFSFSAQTNKIYNFTFDYTNNTKPIILKVLIYDQNFNFLTSANLSDNNFGFGFDFTPANNATYYVKVTEKNNEVGNYSIKYSSFNAPINLSPSSTTQSINANISVAGETDFYTFEISSPINISFWSDGDTDTFADLLNSDLSTISTDDDSGAGTNFKINYYFTTPGKYYLRVRHYSPTDTGSYNLSYRSN